MSVDLSPTAEQRLDLTVALLGGILNGVVMTGGQAAGRADRVSYAQSVADQHRNACFAIAGTLIALNAEMHPNSPMPSRTRAVGTLFAAAVSGLIAAGATPADALTQTNRQRERLFTTAHRALTQAFESDTPKEDPAASRNPSGRLDIAGWRSRRAQETSSAGLSLEPMSEPAPSVSSPRPR